MWSERAVALRAFLRAANGLGARRAEDLWASTCALVNRLSPANPRRWTSSGRERVVVIAPHPDDEATGCAGTLLRHHDAGDRTRIVVVTDGRLSRAYGFDPASLVERRQEEAREAAARMETELEWLGLPEGSWSVDAAGAAIQRLLAELSPTVVYAPSAIDYHPEHRRVAAALASVVSSCDTPPEIRVYGIQVPLTPLLVNLVHDVSDLEQPVRRVLAAYATQRGTVSNTIRLKRYAARWYGGAALAEAFCAMPAQLYTALHARPPAHFRAIHPRAWTDPLAALVGWQERAAWRRQVQQIPPA
jgi:LmbE family N-acetylglucosaminyl deacetylase